MPFESIESLTSFLFDDMEPIITTQEEMERYNKIYLDFQMCLEPEPITSFEEANITIPSGAVAEKAKPVATSGELNTSTIIGTMVEQAREEDHPDIPTSPAEAITTPPPKIRPLRQGRKKNTEKLQRPDWLPEGWMSRVEVQRNGASAGVEDRIGYVWKTTPHDASSHQLCIEDSEEAPPTSTLAQERVEKLSPSLAESGEDVDLEMILSRRRIGRGTLSSMF